METSRNAKTGALLSAAAFALTLALALWAGVSGWPELRVARLLFWMLAMAGLAFFGLEVALRLGWTDHPDTSATSARHLWRRWFSSSAESASVRRGELEESLFYLGETPVQNVARFLLLMLFASLIAEGGIIADSTAVVVGAMLVAPLLTPLMGVALALVGGRPRRLLRAALIAVSGIAVAIFTGWFMPFVLDVQLSVNDNSQIASRVSPTLLDLVIALAAGAAGAYALSDARALSSMTGVAVAIALVPPLCVIGSCLHEGAWAQAFGAVLLFLTNLVAIIGAGGLTFVLTGISPVVGLGRRRQRVRTATSAIAVVAVAVVAALSANGALIARNAANEVTATTEVHTWLGETTEFQVVDVDVDDDVVSIQLVGPGKPPALQPLADRLGTALERSVQVDLQWVERDRMTADSR